MKIAKRESNRSLKSRDTRLCIHTGTCSNTMLMEGVWVWCCCNNPRVNSLHRTSYKHFKQQFLSDVVVLLYMIVRGFSVYDRTWVYCIWSYVVLLYTIVRGFIVYDRTWVYCIWSDVGLLYLIVRGFIVY